MDHYISRPIGMRKTIALIAHDHRKNDLIQWIKNNYNAINMHTLCGTGTTAALIQKETGLPVKGYHSGPLGGDQQIGAMIVEGNIDMLIFFWDPLSAQPHDPDVKALLRIAVLYDIPVANNQATADFLVNSIYMDKQYERMLVDYANRVTRQVEEQSIGIKSIPLKKENTE